MTAFMLSVIHLDRGVFPGLPAVQASGCEAWISRSVTPSDYRSLHPPALADASLRELLWPRGRILDIIGEVRLDIRPAGTVMAL
jgi:hypothetical protein